MKKIITHLGKEITIEVTLNSSVDRSPNGKTTHAIDATDSNFKIILKKEFDSQENLEDVVVAFEETTKQVVEFDLNNTMSFSENQKILDSLGYE